MKRTAIASTALALAFAAFRHRFLADVLFVQIHNLVAVVLWWCWRRERPRSAWLVLAAFVVATLAILSGAFDARTPFLAGWSSPFAGLQYGDVAALVAPWEPSDQARWGARLTLLYAFGQSFHYVVWLRLVPDDDRRQVTPRSFRASWRALRGEIGVVLLGAAAVGAAMYLVGSFFDGAAARVAYLRIAATHGYLELVALGALLCTNEAPAERTARVARVAAALAVPREPEYARS